MRYIPKHADDYGVTGLDEAFDASFLYNDSSEMLELLGDDWSLEADDVLELDMVLIN